MKERDRKDTRGVRRHFKITQAHREFMVKMIERNAGSVCRWNLAEIWTYNMQIDSLHCNHLDKRTYIVKNVNYEPEKANTVENKERRNQFVQKLLDYQELNLSIVYMNQTNVYHRRCK